MEYLLCWTKTAVEWTKVKNLQCEVPQLKTFGLISDESIGTMAKVSEDGWKLVYDKAQDNETAQAFLLNEEGCCRVYEVKHDR